MLMLMSLVQLLALNQRWIRVIIIVSIQNMTAVHETLTKVLLVFLAICNNKGQFLAKICRLTWQDAVSLFLLLWKKLIYLLLLLKQTHLFNALLSLYSQVWGHILRICHDCDWICIAPFVLRSRRDVFDLVVPIVKMCFICLDGRLV